jgi:hypothetical protein
MDETKSLSVAKGMLSIDTIIKNGTQWNSDTGTPRKPRQSNNQAGLWGVPSKNHWYGLW